MSKCTHFGNGWHGPGFKCINDCVYCQCELNIARIAELETHKVAYSNHNQVLWEENAQLREALENASKALWNVGSASAGRAAQRANDALQCTRQHTVPNMLTCSDKEWDTAIDKAATTVQEAIQIVADPSVPLTEVHFRQNGKTLGKIVNLEPTAQACSQNAWNAEEKCIRCGAKYETLKAGERT